MTATDPVLPAPGPIAAYGRDAVHYDARTSGFEHFRRRAVEALPVGEGGVVIDVGCGTGLCFGQLVDRVGPRGRVVGVDPSAEMLAVAGRRIADHGWHNVELVQSPVETADLPVADAALFSAVHDVLQSAPALDNVLGHVRAAGAVVATGGKSAPPWAVAVTMGVMTLHAPYVRSFAGFDRPWALLADRVPGLTVQEIALGGGYLASGRVPS